MAGDAVDLPPNARIESIVFAAVPPVLRVTLRGAEPCDVPAPNVVALFGARLRHANVTTTVSGGGISAANIAVTAATGIPLGIGKKPKETTVEGEELQHALAMRVAGVREIWYLVAESFNFRKALGPDATYSTEMNVRLFVAKLASVAAGAAKDPYFTAMVAKAQLPPPADGLREFLRALT